MKTPKELALGYPQNQADIELGILQVLEFTQIPNGDHNAFRKHTIVSVPPLPTDFDNNLVAALDELKAYRESGTTTYVYREDEGAWECEECDLMWVFTTHEPPSEHGMKYCPQCGRHIIAEHG